MMMFIVFVAAVFLHDTAGLLHGATHSATTNTPDGAVLHQTLGLLVVELEKRVNNLQIKVTALETERQNYQVKNTHLENELSEQKLKMESLQQIVRHQNTSMESLQLNMETEKVKNSQLESELSSQRLKLVTFQQILHRQTTSILEIQTQDSFFKNQSSHFNESLEELIYDHENLKKHVDAMQSLSISPMKTDINHMHNQIIEILNAQKSLSGNLSHDQIDIHNLSELVHSAKPGFTAYLDGDTHSTAGTIILPNVYSNMRTLYDSQTGIFTADRTGLYGFYVGIECVGTSGFKIVDLVKDGSVIGHAACSPTENVISFGSTFSVHYVENGSKVWIKDGYSSSSSIGLRGKTTLTGFLISN